eukprot:CAMPEP_0119383872 /NCGR_PEP_ID=MMETSP1334-20130426/82349_1 /TAXON_ID=127549 /ORGANISM="Calcidiscus leptoporus, Strain RCC1130" /LENGTH=56 /DNA_ID=CAMNT_0007404791 /DNA_START=268 /DNA_END=438 /DNA_ORIENTATION=+
MRTAIEWHLVLSTRAAARNLSAQHLTYQMASLCHAVATNAHCWRLLTHRLQQTHLR